MNDLERKLARSAARVDFALDDFHLARLEKRIEDGVRKRVVRRRRLVVATAIVALLAVLFGARAFFRKPITDLAERRLPDGSTIQLSRGAALGETSIDARGVSVHLAHGAARFAVTPRTGGTTFRVLADPVVIEVIGTEFVVERRDTSVRVAVAHGVVRASREAQQVELHEGEEHTFDLRTPAAPPASSAHAVPAPPAVSDAPAPSDVPAVKAPPASPKEWRVLAKDGDFESAYKALREQRTVRDEPGDQMLAADTARLSGHPSEAVAPLRRVMTRHAKDPRAPLAAFTLGRVLLEEVGDPRGAAEAFEGARRLQPGGPLDESALARAVEAWSRAGESGRARALASEYHRLYPNGEKAKLVKRYAESP